MSEPFDAVMIELNPTERRTYDAMRERIVKRPPESGSGFAEVVLLLPDLTVLLMRLLRDDRVPRVPKFIAMIGVGYVLSPIDLLPALLLGPLGLVDDLLVVSAALSHLLNEVHPDIVRAAWPGQGDALDAIQRVSRWSEEQVGGRIRRALGFPGSER